MICSLCHGRRRVRPQGQNAALPCPRCSGEGALPTAAEIVRLVEEGKASWVDLETLKTIAEARAVLRRLARLT